MRIELTREGLLVYLAYHYTTPGALVRYDGNYLSHIYRSNRSILKKYFYLIWLYATSPTQWNNYIEKSKIKHTMKSILSAKINPRRVDVSLKSINQKATFLIH